MWQANVSLNRHISKKLMDGSQKEKKKKCIVRGSNSNFEPLECEIHVTLNFTSVLQFTLQIYFVSQLS